MARLQILQLPEGASDERAPFVLIVDECVPQRIALGADASFGDYWQLLADRIGARGVIVTPETVDIPANDFVLTGSTDAGEALATSCGTVRIRVEPDLDGFRQRIEEEVARTQASVADRMRLR